MFSGDLFVCLFGVEKKIVDLKETGAWSLLSPNPNSDLYVPLNRKTQGDRDEQQMWWLVLEPNVFEMLQLGSNGLNRQ